MQLDALRPVAVAPEPEAPGMDRALARVALRLRIGRAIEVAASLAAAGAALSLLAGACHALGAPLPERRPWPWVILAGPPLLGAFLGAFLGALRPVARRVAAGVLEARLGRGALLSTALELDPAAPFAPLVRSEVETALAGLVPRRVVPLPRPRALLRALLYAGIGAGLWAIPPWRPAPRVETREVSSLAPEQLEAIRRLESRLSREGAERPEVRALAAAAAELSRLSTALEQGGMREIEALARLGEAADGLRRERERIEARREVRGRLDETRGLEGLLDGRGAEAARTLAEDLEARADARAALLRAAESATRGDPELAEALHKAAAGLEPGRKAEEVAAATDELEQKLAQLPQAYADELVEAEATRTIDELDQLRRTITGEPAPRAPEVAEAPAPAQGEQQPPAQGEQQSPPQGEQQSPPQGEQPSPPQGEQPSPPQGEQQSPPQGEQQSPPQGEQQPPAQGEQQSPPQGEQPSPPQGEQKGETTPPKPEPRETEPPQDGGGPPDLGPLQGLAESLIRGMDEKTLADMMETFAPKQEPGAEPPKPPSPDQLREMLGKLEQMDPEVLKKLARAAQQADLPQPQPGAEPAQPPPEALRKAAEEALQKMGPELTEELKKLAAKQQAGAREGGTPQDGPKQGGPQGQPSQPGPLQTRAGKLEDPALRAAAEEAIATGRAATPETLSALEKADPELARALSSARSPGMAQGPAGGKGRPGPAGEGGRRAAPSGRPIWTPGEGPTESLGGKPRDEGKVETSEGEPGQAHERGSIEVPFERVPERWAEEAHRAVQRQQVPEAYERVVREYFKQQSLAPPR